MKSEKDYLKEIKNKLKKGDLTEEKISKLIKSINKRIDKLEDEPVHYRTHFSEIFHYAEKEFGIGWNPCNDLFFDNALDYKSYNEFHVGDILLYLELDDDNGNRNLSKEEIMELDDYEKSHAIIHHFMVANDIDEIFIEND